MRVAFLIAGGFVVGLAACSKQPPPATVPTPTQTTTTPPPPPPPPPPPASTEMTCDQVVSMMSNDLARMINFDTDRSDIRSGDAGILDAKAEILRNHPQVRLRITGHADERHTDEYNLVLGSRRSQAAKDYLVRRGVDGSRLETASLGETSPLDPRSTEDAWARNRRDEFAVTAGRVTLSHHLERCR